MFAADHSIPAWERDEHTSQTLVYMLDNKNGNHVHKYWELISSEETMVPFIRCRGKQWYNNIQTGLNCRQCQWISRPSSCWWSEALLSLLMDGFLTARIFIYMRRSLRLTFYRVGMAWEWNCLMKLRACTITWIDSFALQWLLYRQSNINPKVLSIKVQKLEEVGGRQCTCGLPAFDHTGRDSCIWI